MSNYKVAVKNDLLIPNVEFQELAAAISKLAEYNGHLSDFEKSSALDIIDSWEKNIIRDLKNKEREFYNFIQCFGKRQTYYFDNISEDLLQKIAIATETDELYTEYKNLLELNVSLQSQKPIRPNQDLNMTFEEYNKRMAEYQLEDAKWHFASKKVSKNIADTQVKFINRVSEHDYMKEALRVARSFKRNINNFTKAAVEKSQLAKLNVTISSPEIRESLKELLDFAIA